VVPFFREKAKTGKIPITDERMTRFWITLEQAVEFVFKCLTIMKGGEIFIPKIPSMKIVDLASVIAPESEFEIIGIRPGEKLHEILIPEDEVRHTIEYDELYIIQPDILGRKEKNWKDGRRLPEGFRYSSDKNERWLTKEEVEKILSETE